MKEKIKNMENKLFCIKVDDIFFIARERDERDGNLVRIRFQFLDGILAGKTFYIAFDVRDIR